jgi:hypothetical protein
MGNVNQQKEPKKGRSPETFTNITGLCPLKYGGGALLPTLHL